MFHSDLPGNDFRSQWNCFVKVSLGIAQNPASTHTKYLPAAQWGNLVCAPGAALRTDVLGRVLHLLAFE